MKKIATMIILCVAGLAHAALAPEMQKIKETGVLKIGVRSNAAPFSVYNNGSPTGYVVELCQKVANDIQKELATPLQVKYVEVSPANRFDMIADGSIDMECGTTTVTRDRQEKADFSINTFVTSSNFVTSSRYKIENSSEYYNLLIDRKQKVALMKGTAHEDIIRRWSRGYPVSILFVDTIEQGLAKVSSGEAFLFVQDRILIERTMATQKIDPKQFFISETSITLEPYSIMVKKGNSQLLATINSSLRDAYRTGLALTRMETILKENGTKSNHLSRDTLKRPGLEVAYP